jgi:hypothetical protein
VQSEVFFSSEETFFKSATLFFNYFKLGLILKSSVDRKAALTKYKKLFHKAVSTQNTNNTEEEQPVVFHRSPTAYIT